MHVEFRLSEIAHTCAFDPESFYRMKQLLASRQTTTYDTHGAARTASDETGAETSTLLTDSGERRLNLLNFPALAERIEARKLSNHRSKRRSSANMEFPKELLSDKWTPQLRVQFVFERLVKMESSELHTTADRKQHEKQIKTNWDGSPIRTKRYSVSPQEVILAALPEAIADCVIKIRLLQMPPDLGNPVLEKCVDDAIGAVSRTDESQQECLGDTPLCIGVAKITLRELMTVRGGVCMALQPKTSMLRAVEALNLNTVATNGMFGKDVGGSSFFTFQVIAFSFGKVPPTKLLLYTERRSNRETSSSREDPDEASSFSAEAHFPADPGSVSRQASSKPHGGATLSGSPAPQYSSPPLWPHGDGGGVVRQSATSRSDSGETTVGRFDSAAVRFVIVPYMTLVDALLKVHDVASWRRPRKTVILLFMLLLVTVADALDIAFMVVTFGAVVSALRTMTMFYRIPITENGAGPLTSALSPEAGEASYAYLYGRHNTLLNALVRARLFFTQGLQEESYYELVLIFHTVRRHERHIILSGAVICISMCLFSFESLAMLTVIGFFFVYPVMVRIPVIRTRKSRRGSQSPITLHAVLKSWMLGAPMHVTRVVQVALLETPSPLEDPNLQFNDPRPSTAYPHALATNSGRGSPSSVVISAVSAGSERSPRLGGNASNYNSVLDNANSSVNPFLHRRARTMDFDYSSGLAAIERQQSQNAARLSFAVVSFTCEPGSMVNNRQNPCGPLLAKLHQHFDRVRFLHDDERNHLSPPSMSVFNPNFSGGNNGGRAPLPNTIRGGVGNGSDVAGALGRTDLGSTQSQQQVSRSAFFRETLGLLTFISRSCTLQSFMSPGTEPQQPFGKGALVSEDSSSVDRVPLEFFARPAWVVMQAPDDGITATLCAMSKNTLTVKKLFRASGVNNDARTLAVLAAYLLQGSRLSMFSAGPGSSTCSVIIPLEQGSARLRSLARPNPCPPRLFQALEEIWCGDFGWGNSGADAGITINVNTVLQIISAYNDEKAATLSRIDGSSMGDDLSPSPQQGGALLSAQQPQQKNDQPHHSTRASFFHAFTSPFTPANAGSQQQQQTRGQTGGASRTPAMGSATSYGALGLSREATTALPLPQQGAKDPPSLVASGATTSAAPQGKRGSFSPPKGRTAKSMPVVGGSTVVVDKPKEKDAANKWRRTSAGNTRNNAKPAPDARSKNLSDANEHSLSTSTEPPALSATIRGGALHAASPDSPQSTKTEKTSSVAMKRFASTTR